MPDAIPAEVLYLIVRFTAAVPDLPLSVSSPHTTTTLSLKQLIREHIPEPHATGRFRLIYAGKVLPDAAPLSTSLKWAPRPPPTDTELNAERDGGNYKGKGKERAHDGAIASSPYSQSTNAWVQRIYIHCSIGDALTPQELESEGTLAANLEKSLRSELASKSVAHAALTSDGRDAGVSKTTSDAPQGFDRLLNSGFTASEVASLRSQFVTNLRFTHTEDDMPTGAALRALEDRWLDSTAQDNPSAIAEGGGGDGEIGWGMGFGAENGGLEDLLFGNLMGFFWPIGALVWGIREEGVWTNRRKIAVLTGIVMNLVFGLIKWSS